MTEQQLKLHSDGLQAIVTSPAFKAVKEHFDEIALQQPLQSEMSDLGKVYIKEKAIKDVFRSFEFFASGITSETPLELETLLEPESLDDEGALDLLNE